MRQNGLGQNRKKAKLDWQALFTLKMQAAKRVGQKMAQDGARDHYSMRGGGRRKGDMQLNAFFDGRRQIVATPVTPIFEES